MDEKLLLLIGKGQAELDAGRITSYRTAKYIIPGYPEKYIETPFVGEALLRLHEPQRFKHVYIFGTRDAMWHVLHFHCLQNLERVDTEKQLNVSEQLLEAVEQRALTPNSPLLQHVAEVFSELVGVNCSCHVIELGTNSDELWDIFHLMTAPELQLDGCRLSIDITHSLRFHPLFFVFTLMYFQAVSPETQFASIYYGALELIRDYGGFAPIFDLKAFVDIMQWIHAAQTFSEYGDPSPIASLLGNTSHVDEMKGFSYMLQLNDVSQIKTYANQLVRKLSSLEENDPRPLHVIAPRLQDFPKKLQRASSAWKAILSVSDHHIKHGRLGLAVLSAWEAVISRLADIYKKVNPKINNRHLRDYKNLSRIVCNSMDSAYPAPIGFSEKMQRLNTFRNQIAHAGSANSKSLSKDFPGILDFLHQHLGDSCLENLPQYRRWKG